MLCDDCRQKPATVHLTRIINNKKEEMHLCEDCAQRHGADFGFAVEPGFSFQHLLSSLLETEPSLPFAQGQVPGQTKINESRCPGCNLSYAEFKQTGFLGCPRCHDHFYKIIEPFLRKFHGNTRHMGKVPHRTGGVVKIRKEIEQLRQRLQDAVRAEEYERAAQIRDEIRGLEKNL
ncbi:MAG: UvrB/UvrC motif-containing protein [Bacillota bacterium]